MGIVYDAFKNLENLIPNVLSKVGSLVLFVFCLGMFFGYFMVSQNPMLLMVPIVSLYFMWSNLDNGVIVFCSLMTLAFIIR